jgi:hypothetical protein
MTETGKKYAELINCYSEVFGSSNGRKVFKDLQRRFFFYTTTINNPESNLVFANEGCRQVLLYVLEMIRKSKNRLLIEQLSKQEEEE